MTPDTLNAIERLSRAIEALADVVRTIASDTRSTVPGLRRMNKELDDLRSYLQLCRIQEAPNA